MAAAAFPRPSNRVRIVLAAVLVGSAFFVSQLPHPAAAAAARLALYLYAFVALFSVLFSAMTEIFPPCAAAAALLLFTAAVVSMCFLLS